MKEIRGNLFDPSSYSISTADDTYSVPTNIRPDAICITTNGFVKKNGRAVMGKGCALEACRLYQNIDLILGTKINEHGNRVHQLIHDDIKIVSFPVKPESELCRRDKANVVRHMQGKFNMGDKVPGWACVANLGLIEDSAYKLTSLADIRKWTRVILPRPGCGAGELIWSEVKFVLDNVLDDRFYSITF